LLDATRCRVNTGSQAGNERTPLYGVSLTGSVFSWLSSTRFSPRALPSTTRSSSTRSARTWSRPRIASRRGSGTAATTRQTKVAYVLGERASLLSPPRLRGGAHCLPPGRVRHARHLRSAWQRRAAKDHGSRLSWTLLGFFAWWQCCGVFQVRARGDDSGQQVSCSNAIRRHDQVVAAASVAERAEVCAELASESGCRLSIWRGPIASGSLFASKMRGSSGGATISS
jgi:hypothetical protein